MFHNILVSIDGSEDAQQALAQAIDLAQAQHARLTILTAVPHPPPLAYSPASSGVIGRLSEELEEESRTILRDAIQQVPAELPVTKIITHEPIRRALLDRIAEGGHDLLIMGSRGRGAVRSALLGSVSHYALHHSPVPVLIVHGDRGGHPRKADLSAAAGLAV
jgi:nucleotide-binding universal stress UspA family protein